MDPEDSIEDKFKIDGDILKVLEAWDEIIGEFDTEEKLSPTILVNEFYKTYTDEEYKKLAEWRRDYIEKNRPLYEKYKDKWDSWYNKHSELLSKREIYCKLEWQVGPKRENDSIFNYFIQLRQSGIRVRRAQYFPTVAISQIPIYGKQRRYITQENVLDFKVFQRLFSLWR